MEQVTDNITHGQSATLPTVDMAVCTWRREGIERFASSIPATMAGVRWLVSWQCSEGVDIPASLAGRSDVTVIRTDSMGLSNNRNNSLHHATAQVVVVADDDVRYTAAGIQRLREAFAAKPDMDFCTFTVTQPDDKAYPADECRLSRPLPKGYYIVSFEMSMRLRVAQAMLFCPEMGIGAPLLGAGEEEIFLDTAMRRGYHCRYLPIVVGEHDHSSSGTVGRLDATVIRSAGAVIRRLYPTTWPLRLPLKAWRIHRAGQYGLAGALKHLVRGAHALPALMRKYPQCFK